MWDNQAGWPASSWRAAADSFRSGSRMSTSPPSTLIRHLRRIAGTGAAVETTDRDLLLRFSANGDEDAFAALVRRHGPLVWSACRRVLGHTQDAEDAFQATFL